jgi:hypothetical protein
MQRVCAELQRREVNLRELHALELFGGGGVRQTQDYAALVSSLEIWEIEQYYEASLRRRFPTATVRITDSYEQIKKTSTRYGLLVADSPAERLYGGYCEHFDLFPDLFQIAEDPAILIVNVIPRFDDEVRRRWAYAEQIVFDADDVGKHLACRQAFYGTPNPERIALDEMIPAYASLARAAGFQLQWHFFQKRHYAYYLVLKVGKAPLTSPGGGR